MRAPPRLCQLAEEKHRTHTLLPLPRTGTSTGAQRFWSHPVAGAQRCDGGRGARGARNARVNRAR